LDVKQLTVRYETDNGDVVAVDQVGFTVQRGERVALVGESGSGKTGTCLAVAGFLTAPNVNVTAEKMTFNGIDLTSRKASRIPRRTPGLSMVFQDATTSLDPIWSIGSQLGNVIRTTLGVGRKEAATIARDWLVKVGLTDTERVMKSRPYELSGGMRQRAMIALALSGRPKLLIADEPTSALDASLSREVMELLVTLTDELGTGLLIVSHDIHLCQGYADRMLVMYGGRIVESGRAANLGSESRHPYTQGLLRSVPTLESATLAHLPTIASGKQKADGGCGFRERCEFAHATCDRVPPSFELEPDHSAACWLAGGDAILVDPPEPRQHGAQIPALSSVGEL
jgi:oligopeptide/dipeptide ABC transporter ATP-binding protein